MRYKSTHIMMYILRWKDQKRRAESYASVWISATSAISHVNYLKYRYLQKKYRLLKAAHNCNDDMMFVDDSDDYYV